MLICHIDGDNMWTDVSGGFAFIPFYWGGLETSENDFYYEWYL